MKVFYCYKRVTPRLDQKGAAQYTRATMEIWAGVEWHPKPTIEYLEKVTSIIKRRSGKDPFYWVLVGFVPILSEEWHDKWDKPSLKLNHRFKCTYDELSENEKLQFDERSRKLKRRRMVIKKRIERLEESRGEFYRKEKIKMDKELDELAKLWKAKGENKDV